MSVKINNTYLMTRCDPVPWDVLTTTTASYTTVLCCVVWASPAGVANGNSLTVQLTTPHFRSKLYVVLYFLIHHFNFPVEHTRYQRSASRGHRCLPFCPPVHALVLSRIRFSIQHSHGPYSCSSAFRFIAFPRRKTTPKKTTEKMPFCRDSNPRTSSNRYDYFTYRALFLIKQSYDRPDIDGIPINGIVRLSLIVRGVQLTLTQ